MTAHRTWRLVFRSSNGGQYVQLSEVAFLDAAGVDLSLGGVASASSEYSVSFGAAKAFDKDASTDWSCLSYAIPAWLQYQHATAVDAAQVRIVCSANPAWLPPDLDSMSVLAGDAQDDVYALSLQSGSITPGGTLVCNLVRRVLQFVPVPRPLGALQGLPGARYSGVVPVPRAGRLLQDMRHKAPTVGVIADRVMFRSSASSPEAPFATGRVWLLRAADGFKAWEGFSDAQGYYRAEGLELGVAYIAVGIDPWGNHKTAAAGPVVATLTGEAAP